MEKMLKKKKLLIVTIVILVAILIWVVVSECVYNPKLYSDEKHMENIERIIENNYKDPEKYSIEPLYNSKEKLEGFMILHNSGVYTLVMIKNPHILLKMFGPASMYSIGSNSYWQRYKIRENEEVVVENGLEWKKSTDAKKAEEYPNRLWETDAEGKEVIYKNQSPYEVAGVMSERKYILQIEWAGKEYFIPAIKCGDKYLNLISMETFDYKQIIENEEQARLDINFIPKNYFK